MVDIQTPELATPLANVASYTIAETLVWAGLGDLFNTFRKSLGLESINQAWGSVLMDKLDIPWTFCWSPAVLPKPKDWSENRTVSGFYFLNLATDYTPPPDLQSFLEEGPQPVYIGFGSITLEAPRMTTQLILHAVHKAGCRALISKGWGGLHCDDPPPGIFMLGNVPHDWLFTKVCAVVHHGGAGSTAIGIKLGKPTIIVPFFGE
jgi:UDP:flavonoid glycosyltransferase YjiC (YdhE family)